MVKKYKHPDQIRLIRVTPENHERLASFCTEKGMTYNEIIEMLLENTKLKPKKPIYEMEIVV